MGVLVTGLAVAQSDGGGKKKKKARVEQTRPAKKPQRKPTKQLPRKSTAKPTTGTENGHEWVDLGLPSGTKWATCNVGASSPSDYGDYFAWGETSPKSSYDSSNSRTYSKNIGNISGNSNYDAARANWGDSWRLPSKAEFEELIRRCKWTWTTLGGKKGYKVVGPNGNSIFLPAAGYRCGATLYDGGAYGCYWSGTPYGSVASDAYYLWLYEGYHYVGCYSRYYGYSIRPVAE